MKKLKVMTVVGTRPELIKLSRVMAELEKYTDHVLVHTGQNDMYELNEIFFKELEIKKPDYFLEVATGKLCDDIANVISRIDPVFEKEKPDAVLFYGDTNSGLAIIPAKRRQIPIFHMEAGNRSFDQQVPEEINRKIMDHLADINMVLTEHARRYLIAEGIRPENIIKTGSCMKEVLSYYMPKLQTSNVLKKLALKPNDYFVLSVHREENVDRKESLILLLESLNAVAEKYNKKIIFSAHPRTTKRLEELQGDHAPLDSRIIQSKPFGIIDYITLQRNAFCTLSDSGTIFEEASILDFPAVHLRNAHERPEGMDVGTLIMSNLKSERLLNAIEVVTSQHDFEKRRFALIPDHDVDNVSMKVVRIILSYVDYINRTVWRKG